MFNGSNCVSYNQQNNTNNRDGLRASFIIYKKANLFPQTYECDSTIEHTNGSNQSSVNSIVVSGAFNGIPIANLTEPVLIYLPRSTKVGLFNCLLNLEIPMGPFDPLPDSRMSSRTWWNISGKNWVISEASIFNVLMVKSFLRVESTLSHGENENPTQDFVL